MTESRLKKILDCLPEMQYVVDRKGNLKYLKFAKGHKGSFDPGESIDKPMDSFFAPHVSKLIKAKAQEVFESGEERNCEYSLELAEFPVPMHFEARLDQLDDDEVLISVRDITSKVNAERGIAESESRYRHLFELNPLPMLVLDTAVPCGLIINELLSNSLKHAFPNDQKGEIRVKFKRSGEGRFSLDVSDNSVGLPGNFDLKNIKSMGIQLVRILTEQLGGELRCSDEGGTTFQIEFNEYHEAGTVIHSAMDPVS